MPLIMPLSRLMPIGALPMLLDAKKNDSEFCRAERSQHERH